MPEPEPDLDLSGWDTAQKLLILIARACGRRFDVDKIAVQGISGIDADLVRGAPGVGLRVKLIAIFLNLDPEPVIGVLPAAVDADGYLGGVHGANNVVVLDDRDGGEMVFVGKGVSDLPVASAVLNDLVGLIEPRQSWTGRYPRAIRVPREPRFARFLTRDDAGQPTIADTPTDGSIPLLDSLVYPRPR